MFAKMTRPDTMENVVIDELDHIPAESRISKAECKPVYVRKCFRQGTA